MISWANCSTIRKAFTEHWDDEAKVPWLSVQSAEGKSLFALSYENPRSVAGGLYQGEGPRRAMFWEYGADDQNQLARQLAESLGSNTIMAVPPHRRHREA